jgi:hypothetical protein
MDKSTLEVLQEKESYQLGKQLFRASVPVWGLVVKARTMSRKLNDATVIKV